MARYRPVWWERGLQILLFAGCAAVTLGCLVSLTGIGRLF